MAHSEIYVRGKPNTVSSFFRLNDQPKLFKHTCNKAIIFSYLIGLLKTTTRRERETADSSEIISSLCSGVEPIL